MYVYWICSSSEICTYIYTLDTYTVQHTLLNFVSICTYIHACIATTSGMSSIPAGHAAEALREQRAENGEHRAPKSVKIAYEKKGNSGSGSDSNSC